MRLGVAGSRQIELMDRGGQTVMTGADDAPLLMLDRVGEGRVALLASGSRLALGPRF